MTVTALLPRRGRLVEVCLSDGTYMRLDRALCEEKGLAVGQSLTDEEAFALEDESDAKRCKERAMYYLSLGDASVKTMTDKLTKAGFRPVFVRQTVARLEQLGLLNDDTFLRRYIEKAAEAHWSRRETAEKAPLKGLEPARVRQVLTEYEDTDTANALWLIEHRYAAKIEADGGVEKTVAALQRKGFGFAAVKEALRQYVREIEENS